MIQEKRPRFYIGLIVFAMAMLLLLFAAPPLQASLGIYGLLLTEIMILACGVIPVLTLGYDIRLVLPVSRPKRRQVFGVLLLWIGTLLTAFLAAYIIMYFFPDKMFEVSKAIGDSLTDAPLPVSLFISAVMPAVCEETLFRGFIQYTFGGLKSKWPVIAVIGVLFGVFHWNPFRFAPTMLLGFALTFIMCETRNIVLPMLFHFINNGVTLSFQYAAPSGAGAVDPTLLSQASAVLVGVILIFGAAVPWLMIAGSRLLKPRDENIQNPLKNKTFIAATVISAFCFLTGTGITVLDTGSMMSGMKIMDSGMKIMDMGYTEQVGAGVTESDSFPITIEEDGTYAISYSVTGSPGTDGATSIRLAGADDQEYLAITAGSIFGNTQKQLAAGNYTLTFEYDYEDGKPGTVRIRFTVVKMPS